MFYDNNKELLERYNQLCHEINETQRSINDLKDKIAVYVCKSKYLSSGLKSSFVNTARSYIGKKMEEKSLKLKKLQEKMDKLISNKEKLDEELLELMNGLVDVDLEIHVEDIAFGFLASIRENEKKFAVNVKTKFCVCMDFPPPVSSEEVFWIACSDKELKLIPVKYLNLSYSKESKFESYGHYFPTKTYVAFRNVVRDSIIQKIIAICESNTDFKIEYEYNVKGEFELALK